MLCCGFGKNYIPYLSFMKHGQFCVMVNFLHLFTFYSMHVDWLF